MDLINKLKRNIKKYKLFNNKDVLVLAVSGGIDSVVLLDIFSKLKNFEYKSLDIIVAHFNHGFRGNDSDLDQKFVRELSQKYGLKFETQKKEVGKIAQNKKANLEEVARKERYKFLAQIVQKYKTQKVVTAHQADDQVETILLNYLRGAKAQGFSGMNFSTQLVIGQKKITIIRPLLNIWRKEIEEYQKKNQLFFRQDKSNFDTRFFRNYLRLKLIPQLEGKYKNFKKKIFQEAEELKNLSFLLESEIEKIYKNVTKKELTNIVIFDSSKFNQLGEELKKEVIRKGIKFLLGNLKNISQKNIINFLKIEKNQSTGKTIVLPRGLRALIDYDTLILLKGPFKKSKIKKKKLEIGENKIKEAGIKIFLKAGSRAGRGFNYDFSKVSFPLFIRSVLPGDSFKPLGFDGSKKLQDFFIDLKIPKLIRGLVPIICDKKGKILGILGIRQSQEFLPDKKTKKFLTIEFKKL